MPAKAISAKRIAIPAVHEEDEWTKVEAGIAAASSANAAAVRDLPLGGEGGGSSNGTNGNTNNGTTAGKTLKDLHAKLVLPALEKSRELGQEFQQKAGATLGNLQSRLSLVVTQTKAGEKLKEVSEKAGESLRGSLKVAQVHVERAMEAAGPSVRHLGQKAGEVSQIVGPVIAQKSRELADVTVQKSRELSVSSQIVLAAASAQTAHTISQIGSHPLEADEDGKHKVKGENTDRWVTGIHEWGVQGLSIVAFVAGFVSMVVTAGHLIDFSAIFMMIVSPVIFIQKKHLKALGDMRGQQNELRHKVNTLSTENVKMKESIDILEQQTEK